MFHQSLMFPEILQPIETNHLIQSAKKADWFLYVPQEHRNPQTSAEHWLKMGQT